MRFRSTARVLPKCKQVLQNLRYTLGPCHTCCRHAKYRDRNSDDAFTGRCSHGHTSAMACEELLSRCVQVSYASGVSGPCEVCILETSLLKQGCFKACGEITVHARHSWECLDAASLRTLPGPNQRAASIQREFGPSREFVICLLIGLSSGSKAESSREFAWQNCLPTIFLEPARHHLTLSWRPFAATSQSLQGALLIRYPQN